MQSHVVHGLVRKRAELAGEIEEAEQALAVLRQKLQHIDGALAVFGYGDTKLIRPKRPARATLFQNGELVRFILHKLRMEGPKTAAQLRDAVMAYKGLSDEDRLSVHRKVIKALERQRVRGTVTPEGGTWAVC